MNIFKINPWHLVAGLSVAVALLLVWNANIRTEVEESTSKIQKLQQELTVTREKVTEKSKEVVRTTTKPDGTVIVEQIKEEKSSKVSDKITDKVDVSNEESTTKVVKDARTRFVVGAFTDIDRSLSYTVGAALGDLPFDAMVMGQDNFKNISVGVQFRW
jgi:hypothetical protein